VPVPILPLSTPAAREPFDESERDNPLRKIAFYAGLGFIFLRLSILSELLLYTTHVNFYLLYIFAPPAILGALATGGIGRTLRSNAGKLWLAYFVWMIIGTPFSSWKGESTFLVLAYARFTLPMLFVAGGLAMNWKEIRLLFYTFAAAALVNLSTARLLSKTDAEGRTVLTASGNIGNSNDLGAQLLLVLPFLLFVVLDRTRNIVLRLALVPLLAYGVWVVLGTASRGCMIALAAMFVFALFRATPGQRAATFAFGLVLAVTIPFLLSSNVRARLSTLFSEKNMDAELAAEARESRDVREYVFKQSVKYTLMHPIFGVGVGQFSNYEGGESLSAGNHGKWTVTHNFMTQISSESGIPALIFVLLSLGTAVLAVGRAYRMAKNRGFRDIENACFCFQLAMIGYVGSIVFLAQAYHYYLPTMVGFAIAISTVAMRYMSAEQRPAVLSPAPPLVVA
jgi:O-antigen ligase